MAKKRAHLIISGSVQGVFFRYTTRQLAQDLGLAGWAMNRRDGKVEVVAEGEAEKVEKLVKWCHKGPEGALVSDVDITWQKPTNEFDSFHIK